MSENKNAVLNLLFAIEPSQIDRDVAEAERNFEQAMKDVMADLRERPDSNEPRVEARRHHMDMIRARVLRSRAARQEKLAFYGAVMAAEHIADEAAMAACDKGRLAELDRQMDEIETREDLRQGDLPPADYQALEDESEELTSKVYATVLTSTLRRYGMEDIADLYEGDRDRFDQIRESGRAMIFGKAAG